MKVLISGASGFIGTAVVAALQARGDEVIRLVRGTVTSAADIPWDPAGAQLDPMLLEGIEAVIHLAGENIAGRWTADKKQRIRSSRIQGTDLISRSLGAMHNPPRVLISASAIGYYGNRGAEVLTEQSPPGTGFLAETCQAWEAAAQPTRDSGIRVVHPRIGVVLSKSGGALTKMLPIFRLGLGGPIGNGTQYFSWIALDDVVGALLHAISAESLDGPVNFVAPAPVTNADFTKTLGGVLHRPTFVPLPAFAARLALGNDAANEMLLGGARVEPTRLLASGYQFRYPELEPALQHIIES